MQERSLFPCLRKDILSSYLTLSLIRFKDGIINNSNQPHGSYNIKIAKNCFLYSKRTTDLSFGFNSSK